ncbi:MAG TPA: RNA polymerase sigma factor [Saprospiraceae bacterium]|nr:RNA polymerase sigma factor [Saprospiraceae bacterium]
MTEDQIIVGCQNNERAAQQQLVYQYSEMLMRTLWRYVKNKQDAEDLLQDVLVLIMRHIHQYRDIKRGSFKGWMNTIAVHEALKHLRRNNKFQIELNGEDLLSDRLDEKPLILDHLEHQDIIDMVNRIPDKYRLVFLLKIVEGYDHAEISKELGIAESSSRSRLLRARMMLKDIYKKLNQIHLLL